MHFKGKGPFGEGPSPVDRLVGWFDSVLDARGLAKTDDREEQALREVLDDFANQVEDEAFSRATRTGDYTPDW